MGLRTNRYAVTCKRQVYLNKTDTLPTIIPTALIYNGHSKSQVKKQAIKDKIFLNDSEVIFLRHNGY